MLQSIDSEDLLNSIYLEQPQNHALIVGFVQESLLEEARVIPKLRDNPASYDIIDLCEKGIYDPLIEMALQEESVEKKISSWLEIAAGEVDLEELLMKSEVIAENPALLASFPQDGRYAFIRTAAEYRCVRAIRRLGVELREHYSNLARAAHCIDTQQGRKPFDNLDLVPYRDSIILAAYPSRLIAELYFTNLNIFQVHITKAYQLLDEETSGNPDEAIAVSPSSLGITAGDIEAVIALDREYVMSEMERIYG